MNECSWLSITCLAQIVNHPSLVFCSFFVVVVRCCRFVRFPSSRSFLPGVKTKRTKEQTESGMGTVVLPPVTVAIICTRVRSRGHVLSFFFSFQTERDALMGILPHPACGSASTSYAIHWSIRCGVGGQQTRSAQQPTDTISFSITERIRV